MRSLTCVRDDISIPYLDLVPLIHSEVERFHQEISPCGLTPLVEIRGSSVSGVEGSFLGIYSFMRFLTFVRNDI